MATQFATRDNKNKITLYLSPTQSPPVTPVELREEITPDAWNGRLASITKTASRYHKQMFERVWSIIAVLAVIVVPVATFPLILGALNVFHLNSDPTGRTTTNHVLEARAISFAMVVGIALVFLLPIAVWKYIGQREVSSMLKKWEKADKQGRGSIPMSTWTVKSPGLLRSNIVLTIQLPPGTPISSFHVNAYTPAFVNPPADADANYYYPYKSSEPGLPRMSTIGNVPLFQDEKRGYYGSEQV
ncbi:hypothetical protein C8F04DRAFT_1065338 [Mycena alexandri]|uniref:Uncharacterized protein n=1 Tax=Mycena alexandri TaxID=1745969 RepID=A0AAD6TJV0_9AGAR|nr:hypothetical protein C8F04DRAFT_1065338 [Mycena alexandri]